VLLFEAGNTVVRAFVEAGIFALAAIAFCCGSPYAGQPMYC